MIFASVLGGMKCNKSTGWLSQEERKDMWKRKWMIKWSGRISSPCLGLWHSQVKGNESVPVQTNYRSINKYSGINHINLLTFLNQTYKNIWSLPANFPLSRVTESKLDVNSFLLHPCIKMIFVWVKVGGTSPKFSYFNSWKNEHKHPRGSLLPKEPCAVIPLRGCLPSVQVDTESSSFMEAVGVCGCY